MAEDLILSAISNLTSLYDDEVHLFQSVNSEREKLERNLSAIKSVLGDAERKQLANSSDGLKDWLQKLHYAAYELDDILDDCSIEDIRDEYEGDKSCAFLGFLHPQKVMFRHSIISRMKVIRERLDSIAKDKDQFKFLPPEQQADANRNDIPNWRQTRHYVTEEVLGREQDKEIIVRHLLGSASHGETLFVYPIVGIGGLGKTALAQLVYNDERVKRYFEIKKWICVSDDFDLKKLFKGIIKSSESPDEVDELVEKLRDMLQGKRYLIVLDDVWNESPDKWMELRSILACGAKGSAVLITTRLEKVAMMMRIPSAQPYRLTALSEEDCWQVLRKRAFGSCIVQETEYLVRIGKDIARKCKGVPLAAKTLGGLLMFTADETFWIKTRDSKFWNLKEEEGSIFAALKLSYINLSPRARRCFSFCSIFPKDHVIWKMDLIHLWMANGLISKGPSTTLELEDMGEEMVNDLYWRSLIQIVNRDPYSGSIFSFKMHDLVHDLAQSISNHETQVLDGPSSTNLSPGTRHISIQLFGSLESRDMCHMLEKFESIRSLVFLRCKGDVHVSSAISHSLKYTRLRALDLSQLSYNLKVLPSSIDVLKHLRYLNLSGSAITELPDSIGSLWNLQNLNVSSCVSLKTFPVSIGRLKSLRYFYNGNCEKLSSMPQSMVGLTSLRTLSLVVMGEPEKKDQLQLSGLEHFNYIRGELQIEHLERVRDIEDVGKANLNVKQHLSYLALRWSYEVGSDDDYNDQQEQIQVLEALLPSSRLRGLELNGYEGIRFSNWMMNEMQSFTCIRSLQLRNCKSCQQLPPLWKLPSLKELRVKFLGSIRYLIESCEVSCGEGFVSFPALEVLKLHSLPVMEKIISGTEINKKNYIIFPRLSRLVIRECKKFNSLNSGIFPSLKKVVLRNLNSLRYLIEYTQDSFGEECVYFPLLKELRIHALQKLEKIAAREEAVEELNEKNHTIFPHLSALTIESCPKLKSFNSGPLPSLRSLMFCDSERIMLSMLSYASYKLQSLEDLCLRIPPEGYVVPFADQMFRISNTPKLFGVVLQLASLQKLSLEGFRLTSLDIDTLTDLPSLKCLELRHWDNLESSPNWMNHLASLEVLKLIFCWRLATLPNCIQQLSNLKELYIKYCPKLKERYEKETGQDWHKIAHIPNIYPGWGTTRTYQD